MKNSNVSKSTALFGSGGLYIDTGDLILTNVRISECNATAIDLIDPTNVILTEVVF